MKGTVRLRERRRAHPQHLAQRLLPGVLEDAGVQPPDGLALFLLLPLGEGRDEGWSNATLLPEPFEGGVFDDGFVEA